ncbi:hypothetical protein GCM10022287_10670 [Gryllotalpicola koreensis]|uniref:Uncharacterized protein n=1 Tax=Gryllotalpicola koreensis TaxID=993086 RepID=A0ABP7ZVE3_9MICO
MRTFLSARLTGLPCTAANHRLGRMSPFAPVIAVTVAFIVLLRVLIWRKRREEKRRSERR